MRILQSKGGLLDPRQASPTNAVVNERNEEGEIVVTTLARQRPHIAIFAKTWSDVRQLFSRLLAYDVLFRMLSAATSGPLTTWLLTTLIASTGSPVVGNTAIIGFILSPMGILTIVSIGTLSHAVGSIETTGLMYIGASRIIGRNATLTGTVWFAVSKIPNLLGLALLQTVITLVVLIPFGVVGGVTYKVLLSQYNINYYLTNVPPEFTLAAIIGVVLVVGFALAFAYLYLTWLFSIPAIIFENRRFYAALGRSRELMRGNYRRAASVVFAWALVMIILTAVVATAVGGLSDLPVRTCGRHPGCHDHCVGLPARNEHPANERRVLPGHHGQLRAYHPAVLRTARRGRLAFTKPAGIRASGDTDRWEEALAGTPACVDRRGGNITPDRPAVCGYDRKPRSRH